MGLCCTTENAPSYVEVRATPGRATPADPKINVENNPNIGLIEFVPDGVEAHYHVIFPSNEDHFKFLKRLV